MAATLIRATWSQHNAGLLGESSIFPFLLFILLSGWCEFWSFSIVWNIPSCHLLGLSGVQKKEKGKLLNGKMGPPPRWRRAWLNDKSREMASRSSLSSPLIHTTPKSNITLLLFFSCWRVLEKNDKSWEENMFGSCRNLHLSARRTNENERHDVSCKMHEGLLWISYALHRWILIHPSIFFLGEKTKTI